MIALAQFVQSQYWELLACDYFQALLTQAEGQQISLCLQKVALSLVLLWCSYLQ